MKVKYVYTYSASYDTFRIGWLVGLTAVSSAALSSARDGTICRSF
eukprot:COSAG01_NODE_6918_length_3439_cov_26.474850_6_plen_45_part_00